MQGILVGLGRRARSRIDICQRNQGMGLVGYVDPLAEPGEQAAD